MAAEVVQRITDFTFSVPTDEVTYWTVRAMAKATGINDQATTCSKPRRVVAKVEWHLGELYSRVALRRPSCYVCRRLPSVIWGFSDGRQFD